MNPALHLSYDELLLNVAARREMLATDGSNGMSASEKVQFAIFLNNAMLEAWSKPRGKDWLWPFTLQTKTVTVNGGVIPLSDLDYGPWVGLWSTDPRPSTSTAYPVPVRAMDADGIYPETLQTSLFMMYVPRVPQFSAVQWVAETAYTEGMVRYDSATGQCWRALQDVTADPAIELTNTDYWQEQLIPQQFNDYLCYYAMAAKAQALNQLKLRADMAQQAQDDLEREHVAAFRFCSTGGGQTWRAGGTWR